MILSKELLLSDQQAITADAASTNYINLGAVQAAYGAKAAIKQDIGKGEPVPILIQVTADFATCTSLQIDLEVDDNTSFSSAKAVESQTILLASLKAGTRTFMQYVPNGADEQYLRVNYTVNGSDATAGNVTAGITMGNQTNV